MRDVLHWLYLYDSGLPLSYVTLSVAVWLALPRSISRNSVFLSAKSHSANDYAYPPIYGDLGVPRVTTDRYDRPAFDVSGTQLWNQLVAAKRATYCTDTGGDTLDCFKQALKASLFPRVGVMLQITAPLWNFLKGGRGAVAKSITLTITLTLTCYIV